MEERRLSRSFTIRHCKQFVLMFKTDAFIRILLKVIRFDMIKNILLLTNLIINVTIVI